MLVSKPEAIAHYLIERELGRGAMGVVYLAHDTKLGRPVAVKSLPAEIAGDPVRRERFEGEARTLAAINHPNIGSIFGLEHQDGSTYLVLEFVEGPTLTDRLHAGALDVVEAIDVCRQVALGIDAAHQRGIVHRDLKPDNIKIRPDGVVKVLDFGIAMAGEVMREGASGSAPTVVAPAGSMATRTGFIVGTPGYMSPEQARGKPVNETTDLWSLGCVLYECLTGRAAFGGESLADALASTLMSEPDLTLLPPRTPARVLDLLRVALRKDLRARTMTLADAAEELGKSKAELSSPGTTRITVSLADDGDWPADPGNLPEATPVPIGRDALVASVVESTLGSRLVTIAGPGGSGRGPIALAAAGLLREQFAGGCFYVRMPALSDADLPGLMTAFALGAKGGAASPAEAAARRIAARRVLLLLDGCQHAPTACATLLHDVLGACPNAYVVATSMTELGLDGEVVVHASSLLASHGPGTAGEAVLQFARRAGASVPEGGEAAAERIAVRLGGWPLALEVAGALSATLPIGDVAERLESRARECGLAAPEAMTPEQAHLLVNTTVLDLLPPGEIAPVLQASVFVGAFGVRALSAVSGARDSIPVVDRDDPAGGPLTARESRMLAMLPKLASRGLLRLIGSMSEPLALRAIMPGPVRAAAVDRLNETPAAALAVAAAHRAYYSASAEQAARAWGGPAAGAWIARTQEELPEMMSAERAVGADSVGPRLRELVLAFRAVRGL